MSLESKEVVVLAYRNKGYEGEEIDKSNNKDDDQENHGVRPPDDGEDDAVPDGGWGWIVAAGGFLGQLMINLLVPCFGILYSKFLLDLGTSAVVSSWIFNLMGFTMTFTGMFVKSLVVEFGFRKTAFIGTLLASVGVTATAFANSAWFLMVFFSIVAGLGNGIMAPLTYSIVPMYFKRRLGVANAIMSSGVSVGQIVGPPLITLLQNQYGYMGATLILGAILLHSGIGATVFHPVEWHKKKPTYSSKKDSNSPGGLKTAFRIFKNTLGNLRLFKNPKASIIAFGATFNVIGYLNFLTIMPFAMQEAGFTVDDAASCLAISGMTNLISRLFVSVMSDYSWFNMRYCYMTGTLLVSGLSIVFCFLTDLTAIKIVMGFWGGGVGVFMGLFNIVMVKYMGIENLLAQIGFTCFVSSIWFLSSGPILGLIRDASDSYNNSIYTVAGTIFITFVLYLFMPAAEAYDRRIKEISNNSTQNDP